MRLKAIMLNLLAVFGMIGSFILSGLNHFGGLSLLPETYFVPAQSNDPIAQVFGHIAPFASFILYGLLLSAGVFVCCSIIAFGLKLKVVSIGYGFAFDVPVGTRKTQGK